MTSRLIAVRKRIQSIKLVHQLTYPIRVRVRVPVALREGLEYECSVLKSAETSGVAYRATATGLLVLRRAGHVVEAEHEAHLATLLGDRHARAALEPETCASEPRVLLYCIVHEDHKQRSGSRKSPMRMTSD